VQPLGLSQFDLPVERDSDRLGIPTKLCGKIGPQVDAHLNSANQEQAICQSCGMCCNGTLFGRTGLKPSGANPDWPKFIIQTISDDEMLPQPCAALENGSCKIYPSRPRACQKFKCNLLKEYASGAITIEEALKVIRNTKNFRSDFIDAVAKLIPKPAQATPNVWYSQFKNTFKDEFDMPEFKRKHAKVLLLFARLNHERNTRFYELGSGEKQTGTQTGKAKDTSCESFVDLEVVVDEMPSEKAL